MKPGENMELLPVFRIFDGGGTINYRQENNIDWLVMYIALMDVSIHFINLQIKIKAKHNKLNNKYNLCNSHMTYIVNIGPMQWVSCKQ